MLMNYPQDKPRYICARCTKEIQLEKYLLLGFFYCRECKNALESDTWFDTFCLEKGFIQIEQ